jgi:hypothetical protein
VKAGRDSGAAKEGTARTALDLLGRAHLHHRHADQQLVVRAELGAAVQLVVVDERAVRRLEVLDDRAVRGRLDARVPARGLGVLDHQVGAVVTSDHERLRDVELRPRSGSLHDLEHQRHRRLDHTRADRGRVKCPRADRPRASSRRGP